VEEALTMLLAADMIDVSGLMMAASCMASPTVRPRALRSAVCIALNSSHMRCATAQHGVRVNLVTSPRTPCKISGPP